VTAGPRGPIFAARERGTERFKAEIRMTNEIPIAETPSNELGTAE